MVMSPEAESCRLAESIRILRQIDMVLSMVSGKRIDWVAEVVLLEITVIAPGGIGIGEMTVTGTVSDALFDTVTAMMTIGIGVDMETGSIAGDSLNIVKKTRLYGRINPEDTKKHLVVRTEGIGKFVIFADNPLAFVGDGQVGIRELTVITDPLFLCGSVDFITCIGIAVTGKDIINT